ncbi:MAG: BTAD domain-containing putative transcriptional regulator [Chloroflexota bacterium]
MSQLILNLFGAFQAQLNGQPIKHFESDKARALLAYLVVEAEEPHRREKLAGLLWSEVPEKKARASLRHALKNLRDLLGDRTIEPPFIDADHKTIQLNPNADYCSDIAKFEQEIALLSGAQPKTVDTYLICSLQSIVDEYRGPFLQGFSLPDCVEFEEWVLLTRERYQTQVLSVLQLLATHFEDEAAYDMADRYAQRQLAIDPFQEAVHRQRMRVLTLNGQRTAAILQYETCRALFADELNVEPATETAKLYKAIQVGKFGWGQPPVEEQSPNPQATLATAEQLNLHNLPASLTPFVGRYAERLAVQSILLKKDARLVTLVGTGGVGKTRLAIEVAYSVLPNFTDGVYLVELAKLRSPDLVLESIAQVVNVQESGSRSLKQVLIAFLRQRKLLLLLDNFEHVLAEVTLVSDLLAAAPNLKVFATSREPLQIYGETQYAVEPLSLPKEGKEHSSENLLKNESIQLFLQGARSVKPSFPDDGKTLRAVARICASLDGLPLAIELAAARIKHLSIDSLEVQFCREEPGKLALLKSNLRNLPSRHQTLAQTIGWSYELLTEVEKLLYRRLSVFAGGCTLEAAKAVCRTDHEEIPNDAVQSGLMSLVEKNLLKCQQEKLAIPRYSQLELIREYGFHQLTQHDEVDRIQNRHADFYLATAQKVEPEFAAGSSKGYQAFITIEKENFYVALQWAISANKPELALRLANALSAYWIQRGATAKDLKWIKQAIQLAYHEPPTAQLAEAVLYVAIRTEQTGDVKAAKEYFEEALNLSRQLNNQPRIGITLALLGNVHYRLGNYDEAHTLHEKSLKIRRELNNLWELGMLLINIGGRLTQLKEFAEARAYFNEGLTLHRKLENPYGLSLTLRQLGLLDMLNGDILRAHQLINEARQLAQEYDLKSIYAGILCAGAELSLAESNPVAALEEAQKALSLYDKIGMRSYFVEALCPLVAALATQNQATRSLQLAGATTKFYHSLGYVMPPLQQEKFDAAVALAKQQVSRQAGDRAWQAGNAMTVEQMVLFALEVP